MDADDPPKNNEALLTPTFAYEQNIISADTVFYKEHILWVKRKWLRDLGKHNSTNNTCSYLYLLGRVFQWSVTL